MIRTPFIAREEHFAVVGSTNDVVRGWLADGVAEVCLAVADEQSAGRGREGRAWTAPAGQALLLSLGFRPTWLPAERVWRLAAVISLAMADAAENVAGLSSEAIRLKWPNDLVVESSAAAAPRKLAGVLGETDGLGTSDPRAVVGIGVNTDWPADAFPADLATSMTSLRAESGRGIDNRALLAAFVAGLEGRVERLRDGDFPADEWAGRQLTIGRLVRLVAPDGSPEIVQAVGVDPDSGALLVSAADGAPGRRAVISGEIQHLRLADGV